MLQTSVIINYYCYHHHYYYYYWPKPGIGNKRNPCPQGAQSLRAGTHKESQTPDRAKGVWGRTGPAPGAGDQENPCTKVF